jgi:hypothetical protein
MNMSVVRDAFTETYFISVVPMYMKLHLTLYHISHERLNDQKNDNMYNIYLERFPILRVFNEFQRQIIQRDSSATLSISHSKMIVLYVGPLVLIKPQAINTFVKTVKSNEDWK